MKTWMDRYLPFIVYLERGGENKSGLGSLVDLSVGDGIATSEPIKFLQVHNSSMGRIFPPPDRTEKKKVKGRGSSLYASGIDTKNNSWDKSTNDFLFLIKHSSGCRFIITIIRSKRRV